MGFVEASGFSSGFDGFVKGSDFGFVKGSDLSCAGADDCVACCASGEQKKRDAMFLRDAMLLTLRCLLSAVPLVNKRKGGEGAQGEATQSV